MSETGSSLVYCQYSRKTQILMKPPGLRGSQCSKLFIFSISFQLCDIIYKHIKFDSAFIGFLWQLPPMPRLGDVTIKDF